MGKTPFEEKSNLWQSRWSVMSGLIGNMAHTLPQNLPYRDTFSQLLSHLQAFGQGQFDYFYTKLTLGESAPTGFSQEYALSQTLDQIGRDMTLIAQAIHQREIESPREVRNTLELADEFAAAMLKPAQRYLGGVNAKVITYLNKSDLTRVLPYASVALIGVPFSTVNLDDGQARVTRDYLAIPHEVGHYVYWHGAVQSNDAYNGVRFCWALPHQYKTGGVVEWAQPWAEEVFADTYGARTAGPMITVDFQDLLVARDSLQDFIGNNGTHPTSFIRPEGYCHTLDHLGRSDWASTLRDAWIAKRDYVAPGTAVLNINGGQPVPYAQASSVLAGMVNAVNERLPGITFDAQRASTLFNDINGANSDDVIYQMWRAEMDGNGVSQGTSGSRGVSSAFDWATWKARLLIDVAKVEALENAQAAEWKVVLGAGGWVDGPGSNPPFK